MISLPKITKRGLATAACLSLCGAGLVTAASATFVPLEARYQQSKLEQLYERGIADGLIKAPFRNSDIEIVGRITYPRLRNSAIVLSTGTEEALDAGPSLAPGSPLIGQPGTSVIAAHRETHFAFLRKARVGDIVEASDTSGVTRTYRVTEIEIADADEIMIPQSRSENRLLLYTCYPFGSRRLTDERFAVHAELVS